MKGVLALLLFAGLLPAQTLDVPLTVEETVGVNRAAEPVTTGVPLPKGMLRDEERLRLIGPDGKPVPAYFRVVNRWWTDPVFWVDCGSGARVELGRGETSRAPCAAAR